MSKGNGKELIISLARLEKEPVAVTGDLPVEFFGLEEASPIRIAAPVHYDLKAKFLNGSVLVDVDFSIPVKAECGRCLEMVSDVIECEKVCLFFEEDELGEETLDLREDVRAEVLIALPLNMLCSEDCAGLCPICGQNLNDSSCDCPDIEGVSGDSSSNGSSPWDALDGLKK